MKTLKSAKAHENVIRLAETIDARRTLDAEEKALKDWFKAQLDTPEGILKVGIWLVDVAQRTRTDLDKKALAVEMGERLREFEKKTTYQIVDVKKA